MAKIRILLVDDHILMRMGLVSATQSEPDMEIVAEAEDAEEGIRAFRQHRPDIVILDLRMPKMDGIEMLTALRQEFGAVKVLVLSNYSAGDEISRAIQAGAAGYVIKGAHLDQLLEAIRSVYSGNQYIPAEISKRLAERVQSQLSAREIEVLKLVARGHSNKEIAGFLHIVEGTVKIHVTNILSKLQVADRTQAVVVAMKRNIFQLD
jgi:DNA-binding NarL/FixJ family response regulator